MLKLYAARDRNTGKLVNDITDPHRRFWERRGFCEAAIRSYGARYARPRYDMELVELRCYTEEELFGE